MDGKQGKSIPLSLIIGVAVFCAVVLVAVMYGNNAFGIGGVKNSTSADNATQLRATNARGYVEISKIDKEMRGFKHQGNAKLTGATYGVYSDMECTNQVSVIVIDDTGEGRTPDNAVSIAQEYYYVKEIKAPVGYRMADVVYRVKPIANESSSSEVSGLALAQAAVTLAWPSPELGYNDNGTDLYQQALDEVFPGDKFYKSSDRAVAVSARWSGVDTDYPVGPVEAQEQYVQASSKWQDVTDTIKSEDDLEPGDVWITIGGNHTFIYTGHEIIEQIYGSDAPSTANYVEASLNDYSPHCDTLSFSPSSGGVIYRSGDGRPYKVWRISSDEAAVTEEISQESVARILYSSLKSTYGMDDAHIAGALAGFDVVSGLDVTAVETIYDEPYSVGPKKKSALSDMNAFTRNVVFNAYAGIGNINTDFYCQPDGIARCGIGINGVTGPECKRYLDAVSACGVQWYDPHFQIAYELAKRESKWNAYKSKSGSETELARYFVQSYMEQGTVPATATDGVASKWLSEMADWSVNSADATKVTEYMNKLS